jgi:GNAT superfamily N-acetyltransferase
MQDPYHDGDGSGATAFNIYLGDGAEAQEVSARLGAEVAQRFGPRDEQPLTLVMRRRGALAAGLNGASHWRWLYIRQVFVAPEFRRQGLGRRLMAQAESEARGRGCIGVYLDTFEESAALFYERLGFSRCGRIENFPPGGARVFLRKTL